MISFVGLTPLSHFDSDLSYATMYRYAEKTFARDGISILTSHHVDWVKPVGLSP